MDRFSLMDAQWKKMRLFCLGKATDPGRTGGDARLNPTSFAAAIYLGAAIINSR
jgi:hypothetical protein